MTHNKRNILSPPLQDRLRQDVTRLRAEAGAADAGPHREALLLEARQTETASHLDMWLSSLGLWAPQ
jgi:hypothetical protein